MNSPVQLRISQDMHERLWGHLFPGDDDEHGAVIAAGLAETDCGTQLLARELILARDGTDYVPGTYGYRALTARFVAMASDYCSRESLCYIAVHNHRGRGFVQFSQDDIDSHERGYPALLDISKGRPVGALVLADSAAAGDIWTLSGRRTLSAYVIVGPHVREFYPSENVAPGMLDARFERHALLFGRLGQERLAKLRVGIVGLGGAGSLINQQLAHLGVGHILAVDFDRIDRSNLPRVVGSRADDLGGTDRAKSLKVHIAQRVAASANPEGHFEAIDGDLLESTVAMRLRDCDFVFLSADGMQPRLVFNALVHQYLIPGVQVGVKVQVDKDSGEVRDISVASRLVLPGRAYGCLKCHNWLPPALLQEEAMSAPERAAQRYVNHIDVQAPSVITLNSLATSQAVNDFLFMFTGLFEGSEISGYMLAHPRQRVVQFESAAAQSNCLHCGEASASVFGRGDGARLPCRE